MATPQNLTQMKKSVLHLILLFFLTFAQTDRAQELTGSGIRDGELPCLPSHGGNDNVSSWCGEESVTQTIALSAGTNWVSVNVEVTLDDLKAALLEALPSAAGNAIKITSQNNGKATWNGRMWTGQMRALDVTQMYKITVPSASEITLQGTPVNPAEHPVTIVPGANWMGYQLQEGSTVTNIFAGFPTNSDAITSEANGKAIWNGRMWTGGLRSLVPGEGFIYNSVATEDRVFTFPTNAK